MELSALERAVLAAATSGHGPTFTALSDQLAGLRVRSREFTGHGFFTEFTVRNGAQRCVSPDDLAVAGVYADLEGLEEGAGFVLFVRDGLIKMLEGFAFDEPWPDRPRVVRVFVKDLQVQSA